MIHKWFSAVCSNISAVSDVMDFVVVRMLYLLLGRMADGQRKKEREKSARKKVRTKSNAESKNIPASMRSFCREFPCTVSECVLLSLLLFGLHYPFFV